MSKTIKRELSTEPRYSEQDIVEYLESFLKGSLCGDCFDGSPWGKEENKGLYVAVFGIGDGYLETFRERLHRDTGQIKETE